jgi:2-polyprenyl-6-methoxyphenol hydroxylase-like FAD-dependent oxidoreductase
MSTDTTPPRIAIIGAGPGGLTCARVLQLAGIPVTVFDADTSLESRDQGGTLDLHADSGQIAIEDARLTARFAELARPEGQSHRMLAPDGSVLVEQVAAPDETAAPEIDRAQLRRMLAESLDPGTIRWGTRITDVRSIPGGSAIEFDGGSRTADVLIGADGAWSRVRRLLSDRTPDYTGVSFVEVRFDDVSARHPEIDALVGDGHMWANGDGRAIILQRNSGDRVRGYLGMRIELDWLARAGLGAADGRGGVTLTANGTQVIDTEAVRAVLREEFAEFAPSLLRVIAESEGRLADRPIFALPTPFAWDHVPGVTLLGDAAHVMSPFGGNGVNLAMLDGAELAREIIAAHHAGEPLDAALRRYESRMILRSEPIAAGSNAAIVEHFAAGGPDLDGIPDFDAEAERLHAEAAAYRAARGA